MIGKNEKSVKYWCWLFQEYKIVDPWSDLKENLVKFAKLHSWHILPEFQSVNVPVRIEIINWKKTLDGRIRACMQFSDLFWILACQILSADRHY